MISCLWKVFINKISNEERPTHELLLFWRVYRANYFLNYSRTVPVRNMNLCVTDSNSVNVYLVLRNYISMLFCEHKIQVLACGRLANNYMSSRRHGPRFIIRIVFPRFGISIIKIPVTFHLYIETPPGAYVEILRYQCDTIHFLTAKWPNNKKAIHIVSHLPDVSIDTHQYKCQATHLLVNFISMPLGRNDQVFPV